MNWFKKHLNWTLLIALFIGAMLYQAADLVSWYLLLRISSLVAMLVAQGWYLRMKNRNLCWLFLIWLIGGLAYSGGSNAGVESAMFVAGLFLLCLRNKNKFDRLLGKE